MFKVKLVRPGAIPPVKAKEHDAGFDVFSADRPIGLGPNERYKFPLGFAIELPPGWVAIISEKSGLAVNHGIITIGNIIDAGYRGECHATLYNSSQHRVDFLPGQKIAQMLVMPCYTSDKYHLVDELSESDRGTGGFGSTGLGHNMSGISTDKTIYVKG